MTATEAVWADPATATRSASKSAVLALGLGGLLMAAGGNLHPRAERATVRDTLADMLGSPFWNLAHLLLVAGLVLSVGAFVIARRAHAFGPSVYRWLTIAIVGWGLASIELVPHLLAVRDLEALHHHEATPILDTHLFLAVGATPALGLSAVPLSVAMARPGPCPRGSWPASPPSAESRMPRQALSSTSSPSPSSPPSSRAIR